MKLLKWLWVKTLGKRKYDIECVRRYHDSQLESFKSSKLVFDNANRLWEQWYHHTKKFVNGE